MRLSGYFITALLISSLAACATEPPRSRGAALATLERVQAQGGDSLLPAEFQSTIHAYRTGESLQKEREEDDAERYFQLALLKGELLEKELRELKVRRAEAAKRAEQEKRAALERKAREEASRRAQAEVEALAQREVAEPARRKSRPQKEHVLVSSYTVRRGESLPLIASQPEVYGDRTLWPLLYRANRDQIRDPRHIWPGQVLRVPRNLGRDDISEARRYAQDRPLH